ncbi:hypothetical protein [Actinacidiphila glaucinigra]|uniref:hypothetical protein n=1 Tax=Actinacidiphila glaucinigra TaxID=235986 RepID=UPI002E3147DE|nr:hypothetical protein [Actinacidiphila glaucinigra]
MATGRRGCAGPGRAEQGRRRAPARSPHDRSLLGRAAQAAPGDADVAVATARGLQQRAAAVNGTATGLEGTAGLDRYVVHRTITRPR